MKRSSLLLCAAIAFSSTPATAANKGRTRKAARPVAKTAKAPPSRTGTVKTVTLVKTRLGKISPGLQRMEAAKIAVDTVASGMKKKPNQARLTNAAATVRNQVMSKYKAGSSESYEQMATFATKKAEAALKTTQSTKPAAKKRETPWAQEKRQVLELVNDALAAQSLDPTARRKDLRPALNIIVETVIGYRRQKHANPAQKDQAPPRPINRSLITKATTSLLSDIDVKISRGGGDFDLIDMAISRALSLWEFSAAERI